MKLRVLELQGKPRSCGRDHGESFRKEIRSLAEIRMGLVRGFLRRFSEEQIHDLALRQVDALRALPEMYDEFVGISEGAGVSFVDLLVLNNYTDLRDFDPGDEFAGRVEGGCSTFSVRSEESALCGQTWDMHASAEPYMIHLRIPEKSGVPGQEILTLTGCLGLAGVNTWGVSVLINNMHCRETGPGVPWPAAVRSMLLCKSAREARDALEDDLPSSGHNYLISDPREALNVETTGRRLETSQELLEDGVIFHTNHYVGKLVSEEILSRRSPTTLARYQALGEYFQKTPLNSLTYEKLAADLLSEKGSCGVVVPRPGKPHEALTCGGILLDLSARRGETFRLFYDSGMRFEFRFT